MNFFFKTLGCKMNYLDSARIGAALQNGGHIPVETEEEADIIFVNSCTVTARADRQSRQEARKGQRNKKQVAVFGCSVRANYEKWKKDYPDFLLFKDENDILNHFNVSGDDIDFPLTDRTRIPVAIQTGCDNFCTFCITRIARGKTVDFPLEGIIRQVNRIVEAGIKEIVLTGIQLASWGCNDSLNNPKSSKLGFLIQNILSQTKIERIRISSFGPQFFNKEFLEVMKNPRVCDHLHLSVQSGSPSVLEKMNRGHDDEDVYLMCDEIKKVRPDVAFTADFIVGFPGETDIYFGETVEMVKKIGFSKLHVFPFSPREGTGAANFSNQLPSDIKKERAKKLRDIGMELQKKFYKKFIGKKKPILVETAEEGLTSNYIRLKVKNGKNNEIREEEIKEENFVWME